MTPSWIWWRLRPTASWPPFAFAALRTRAGGVGYTDPIGTHAHYKSRGLGKAMVTAGLHALRDRGAKSAELGTSSENVVMQRLAEALGFIIVSESLWFCRVVA